MRFWIWIAVLAELTTLSFALPARFQVGGLFDVGDEELETAFRIAVDKLNQNETPLQNSRLDAKVERLQFENTFNATQKICSLLQSNITAIFGPQSELPNMHVQSICDTLEVPHIVFRWEYRMVRDFLSVNLYPNPEVLNKAFLHILEVWGWKEFFLVYEEDEAIVRMKDFLTRAEEKKWSVLLFQFKKDASYRDTFWDIKLLMKRKVFNTSDCQIVLDVPEEHILQVLNEAQDVGMVTEDQKYLITSLDMYTINMERFQYSRTNITGLRLVQDTKDVNWLLNEVNKRLPTEMPPLPTLKTETALMYDSVTLLAFALQQMDSAKHIWNFPSISCKDMKKGVDGTSLVNFMKTVTMKSPGLTGFIKFDSEGLRSSITLDVMHLTRLGITKIAKLMDVNEEKHLQSHVIYKFRKASLLSPSTSLFDFLSHLIGGSTHARRKDDCEIGDIVLDKESINVNITTFESTDFRFSKFEGHEYKVTTLLSDPYAMIRECAEVVKGNDLYEGYGIEVLEALSGILRFTYKIHVVGDNKHGNLINGTDKFNGMVGEVMSGVADFAIGDLTINADRLTGVDFTQPFMQTGISILFNKPTQKVTSLFSFLLPFSAEVWLLMMMAYIFVTLTLFIIGRMSPYEWSNPHPCRQNDQVEENCFSLLNSMWFTIGGFMQQGSEIAPTSMSTRAFTSIWYFFCLIITSSYTANLAAFLTIETLVSPIKNIEDLANQEKIKYGCFGNGSTCKFFEKSESSTFKKMHEFMQAHASEVYVKTNQDGIDKVKLGGYAFLMEATTIEYTTERECKLTQVGGLLDSKGYGIAIRKGNPEMRDWLSKGILNLQEEGNLTRIKERWWRDKRGGGRCSAPKTPSSVKELGLVNVGGVFVVLLLGMCLSAGVAIVEFLWFQRKVRRDPEMSVFKLLMKEIQYAVSCGRSTKPAPKLKK